MGVKADVFCATVGLFSLHMAAFAFAFAAAAAAAADWSTKSD
jgi:hypothetical protein